MVISEESIRHLFLNLLLMEYFPIQLLEEFLLHAPSSQLPW